MLLIEVKFELNEWQECKNVTSITKFDSFEYFNLFSLGFDGSSIYDF